MSKPGIYDPTSIMSVQALKVHQREGVNLYFIFYCFFTIYMGELLKI